MTLGRYGGGAYKSAPGFGAARLVGGGGEVAALGAAGVAAAGAATVAGVSAYASGGAAASMAAMGAVAAVEEPEAEDAVTAAVEEVVEAGVDAGQGVLGGSNLTTVSRWGRPGLQSGDWIMRGPANYWNYIRTFKWQPGLGNQFAAFASGEEFQVPESSVQWPTDPLFTRDGWWKGLFGQRLFIP